MSSYGSQIMPYVILGVESIPPGLVITLDGEPAVGPGGPLVAPGAVPVTWGVGRRVGVRGAGWEASTPLFDLSHGPDPMMPNIQMVDGKPQLVPVANPMAALEQEALRDWPVPLELRGALSNQGYISEVRKGGGAGRWLTVVFQGPVGSGGAPGAITRRDGVGAVVLLGVVVVAGVVLKYLFGRRR